MAPEGKPLVIALEEHYYDHEVAKTFDGPEGRAPEIRRRLDDLRVPDTRAPGLLALPICGTGLAILAGRPHNKA